MKVNNVDIENSSNTISDALEDITLNLNDVTTGNQTLTITTDNTKATKAINDWVTAYNSLQDTFSSLTKYTAVDAGSDAQNTSNGALLGDSTLRTIQTQLRSVLNNPHTSSISRPRLKLASLPTQAPVNWKWMMTSLARQ